MDMNRAHRGAGQRGSDAFDHCCIAADEEEYRSEHHLTRRWCRERGHRIDLLSICHSLLAPFRIAAVYPLLLPFEAGADLPNLLGLAPHRTDRFLAHASRDRCTTIGLVGVGALTGQRLRYGKARLRRQRWHAQRISTTMTQPHQQYSCHRGRQPTRRCTVPTIHLHVNFSPLKFATSYAHRSPFDSTRYLSRTPTIGEDLEEPPTVHDDA